jgi:(heptosyl)LPS beta-1,4-glucosyltransferase
MDSLEDYINKRNRYAREWAENQYAKGRKTHVVEILVRCLFAFFRHYVIRLGVMDGYHGFLISVIQMQYTFNKYNFLKFRNRT